MPMQADSFDVHFPPTGETLKNAFPDIFLKLVEGLKLKGHSDIIQQLNNVAFIAQKIAGTPDDFSFSAFPFPRLTFEQRGNMEIQNEIFIVVNLQGAKIRIDLDSFGQINWFYINGMPETYASFQRLMSL